MLREPEGSTERVQERANSHSGSAALRALLEEAAVRDRDPDREIAHDWRDADEEAWSDLALAPLAGTNS